MHIYTCTMLCKESALPSTNNGCFVAIHLVCLYKPIKHSLIQCPLKLFGPAMSEEEEDGDDVTLKLTIT